MSRIRNATISRGDRPLVLIDIAVPRNIESAVAAPVGVRPFDIDALQTHMDAARAERATQIPLMENIIAEELVGYERRTMQRGVAPVISDLHQKAEMIRRKELNRTLRYLPDLNELERKHVAHLSLTCRSRWSTSCCMT